MVGLAPSPAAGQEQGSGLLTCSQLDLVIKEQGTFCRRVASPCVSQFAGNHKWLPSECCLAAHVRRSRESSPGVTHITQSEVIGNLAGSLGKEAED